MNFTKYFKLQIKANYEGFFKISTKDNIFGSLFIIFFNNFIEFTFMEIYNKFYFLHILAIYWLEKKYIFVSRSTLDCIFNVLTYLSMRTTVLMTLAKEDNFINYRWFSIFLKFTKKRLWFFAIRSISTGKI